MERQTIYQQQHWVSLSKPHYNLRPIETRYNYYTKPH